VPGLPLPNPLVVVEVDGLGGTGTMTGGSTGVVVVVGGIVVVVLGVVVVVAAVVGGRVGEVSALLVGWGVVTHPADRTAMPRTASSRRGRNGAAIAAR
jgi:hypothetical protein